MIDPVRPATLTIGSCFPGKSLFTGDTKNRSVVDMKRTWCACDDNVAGRSRYKRQGMVMPRFVVPELMDHGMLVHVDDVRHAIDHGYRGIAAGHWLCQQFGQVRVLPGNILGAGGRQQ